MDGVLGDEYYNLRAWTLRSEKQVDNQLLLSLRPLRSAAAELSSADVRKMLLLPPAEGRGYP